MSLPMNPPNAAGCCGPWCDPNSGTGSVTLTLSGVTFCACVSDGAGGGVTISGVINGTYVLPNIGFGTYFLDLGPVLVQTEYSSDPSCSTTGNPNPLDLQFSAVCAFPSGTSMTLFANDGGGASFFSGTLSSPTGTATNTQATCAGGTPAAGGAATIILTP